MYKSGVSPSAKLLELAFILKDLLVSLRTPINKKLQCIADTEPILWPEHVLVLLILPTYTIPT